MTLLDQLLKNKALRMVGCCNELSNTILTTMQMAQSTPNIACSDTILYITSSIFTYAPCQTIWETLIDTSTWPSWNTFCPRVTIRDQPQPPTAPGNQTAPTLSPVLQKGTKVTFYVHMDPASHQEQDVHLVVTEFQPLNTTMCKPGQITWGVDSTALGNTAAVPAVGGESA